MFNRLSRDYWGPDVSQPFLRIVMALLGGPMIVAPLLLLIGFAFDYGLLGDLSVSMDRTLRFAPFLAIGTIIFAATLGLAAMLLLWSLRRRGVLDFMLAGLVVGLVACGIILFATTTEVKPETALLALAFSAFYFALVMVAVRWVAGIRVPG